MECANDNTESALMKRCRETGQTPAEVLEEALKVLIPPPPKVITVDGKRVEATPGDMKPAGVPAKSESSRII